MHNYERDTPLPWSEYNEYPAERSEFSDTEPRKKDFNVTVNDENVTVSCEVDGIIKAVTTRRIRLPNRRQYEQLRRTLLD